jgi:formate hydrogenlyase subunit 6/NADH:ubiquinone oxidoreductase subunit I
MAPAGNSLENRFPENLAITLSRCIGCHECQQIFVPTGNFVILEKSKNRKGLNQVNKVDGPFFMDFLARNSRNLNASCAWTLPL